MMKERAEERGMLLVYGLGVVAGIIVLVAAMAFLDGRHALGGVPSPVSPVIENASLSFARAVYEGLNATVVDTWQDCYWLDCPGTNKTGCWYYCTYWGKKYENGTRTDYLLDFYCTPEGACGMHARLFEGERHLGPTLSS